MVEMVDASVMSGNNKSPAYSDNDHENQASRQCSSISISNTNTRSADNKEKERSKSTTSPALQEQITEGSSMSSGKRDLSSFNKNTSSNNFTTNSNTFTSNAKRGKKEWLLFRGTRHSRVGEMFQVALLPAVENVSPGSITNGEEK
jgi:hypothetical protein